MSVQMPVYDKKTVNGLDGQEAGWLQREGRIGEEHVSANGLRSH